MSVSEHCFGSPFFLVCFGAAHAKSVRGDVVLLDILPVALLLTLLLVCVPYCLPCFVGLFPSVCVALVSGC